MNATNPLTGTAAASDQAAIVVDYDNLYAILEAQSSQKHHPSEYASEIIDEVRRYLEEGDDTPTILSRAYADYAQLPDGDGAKLQSLLYREGIEPVTTPASIQGNTSELRLCLDVCSLLYDRPDLGTIVIVTGDRPYLPLVRRIRESGRRALVAAVNPPRTDDRTAPVEDDAYLDARNLLSQSSREDLIANAPNRPRAQRRDASAGSPPPRRYRDITNPVARRTVEITEEHFGQYEEVYLTPLLRKLSDILGQEHDPKSLVSELEAAGAVRLEKRDGYPYDYTVLIVNEDHPDVQEIQDDYYSSRSSYDGNGYSDYDASKDDASDASDAYSGGEDFSSDAGADGGETAYDGSDHEESDDEEVDSNESDDAPSSEASDEEQSYSASASETSSPEDDTSNDSYAGEVDESDDWDRWDEPDR